ncbi:unnamed protein product [Acanthoscelides obtectus]|uniref:Uncharacterized protein n=1 Tax=Acanthoscelides obtectus TaxID=200917 RepID=A0A9P0K3T4_ACAOB|nr:unnamed protein product [Acanthoscelides obtectus]CAK1658173.1 hypothetical protein AOBTE_LOCUS20745 [Acanthoscelides obtectus]
MTHLLLKIQQELLILSLELLASVRENVYEILELTDHHQIVLVKMKTKLNTWKVMTVQVMIIFSMMEMNSPLKKIKKVDKSTGKYAVVQFEQSYFPGQITNVSRVGATVNVMESAGKQSKWPLKKDEIFYRNDEIVMGINVPMQRGKRALFDVPELKDILE